SIPQDKVTEPLTASGLQIGDRTNMVYRGTFVTGGNGLAIVVATGHGTEIGRIQQLIAESPKPLTPLQSQMDSLSRELIFASFAIGGIAFFLGLLRGMRALEMSDEELGGELPSIHVFSRVDPSQKLKIVRAYQRAGKVVAMTGDGVND